MLWIPPIQIRRWQRPAFRATWIVEFRNPGSATIHEHIECLEAGSQKQLFIDQRFMPKSERVILRTNPGQKLGQILDSEAKPLMEHVSRVICQ